MEQTEQSQSVVSSHEPPNGMYPARVDDKGRLKLPVGFQQYLTGKSLFVTSLDRRIGCIYISSDWRDSKKFLDDYKGPDAAAAARIVFNAQDLGADAEVDGQGRLLLPPEMRRELGFENQSVRLYASKAHIRIMSESLYEERKKQAAALAQADLAMLEGAGLR